MPMPSPHSDEKKGDFVDRCMGEPMLKEEFPDAKQRRAVCEKQWGHKEDMSQAIPAYATLSEGAEVTFAPAKASSDGLTEFELVVYTGKTVRTFFGDMVVDVAGMKIGRQRKPVLLGHVAADVVGHSTKIEKTYDGRILLRGVASGTKEVSDRVVVPARNGFPWQSSMGFSIDHVRNLEKDSELELNGRKIHGPLLVVDRSSFKEASFLPLGADDDTSGVVFGDPATCGTVPLGYIMIACEPAAAPAKELCDMTKDEIIQQAPEAAEAIRGEGAERERGRVRAMREAFDDKPDFVAESIIAGLTIEQATVKYLVLLRAERDDLAKQLANAKKALGDESGAVGFAAPKDDKPVDEPPAKFDSYAAQAKWEWEHKKTADGVVFEQCSDEAIYTRFRVAQLSGRVKIKDAS